MHTSSKAVALERVIRKLSQIHYNGTKLEHHHETDLSESSLVQHSNSVCILYCAQAVGDHKHSASCDK